MMDLAGIRWRPLTVGTGDHDLELVAPLARVGRGAGIDGQTPEHAFDVRRAGRVGAVGPGVDGRVALKVEVEGGATLCSVAELLAFDGVVGRQSILQIVPSVGQTIQPSISRRYHAIFSP